MNIDDTLRVIRVQAMVRGFLERRRYRVKLITVLQAQKYFKTEEARETLANAQKFNDALPVESRTHTYACTGAVYTGQWKGGFRHGHGEMLWSDGSRYVGSWDMGLASGTGLFKFSSGDEYDGQWHNNKAHGKGKYKNSKGAVYDG